MPLDCPKCGSRFLRDSVPRTSSERLSRFWFVSPLRCLDCHTRFVTQTIILRDMLFARCPKCMRMDLARWTGNTFDPPFWMKMKITFGGNRWRCEYCRMNFAAWRPRCSVFSFKMWKQRDAGKARAEGRSRVSQLQLQTERELELKMAAIKTRPVPSIGDDEEYDE